MKNWPRGFWAQGARAGLYPRQDKLDVALFYSQTPCSAAAVLTTNRVKAAPVVLSAERLRSGRAQAVLINSGCANACTGSRGLADAKTLTKAAAQKLKISDRLLLTASTGVIGAYLPMEKLAPIAEGLCGQAQAGDFPSAPEKAVAAIMTTDTKPKWAQKNVVLSGGSVNIWGCSKGSGMIHPNMATMLAVVLTDAKLDPRWMKTVLKRVVDRTFNSLSVDGDTSTNDSLFWLANGMGAAAKSAAEKNKVEAALLEVCENLARQMAADGEGATHSVEIEVRGAKSEKAAKQIAATIATSPLVKTAIFGQDANWGRVMAAAGRAGVVFNPEKSELFFGTLKVFSRGLAVAFDEKKAREILGQKEIKITLDLQEGKSSWKYFTCDFSLDYVKINADYRS